MNSFTMIGSVIASCILLFAGLSLQRQISYIRMAASIFLLSVIISMILHNRDLLIEALQSDSSLAELWRIGISADSFIGRLLFMLPSVGLSLLSLLLVRLSKTWIQSISVSLSILLTLLLGGIVLPIPLSIETIAILATVGAFVSLIIHIRWSHYYHIVATSITGGIAVSFLFTQFYFLPWWLFGILAAGAIAIGLSSQLHGYRKRVAQEEVITHE